MLECPPKRWSCTWKGFCCFFCWIDPFQPSPGISQPVDMRCYQPDTKLGNLHPKALVVNQVSSHVTTEQLINFTVLILSSLPLY